MDFLPDINKSDIDTDIDNYTLAELLIILDLDSPDQEQIIQKTNAYIEKFDDEGNDEMAYFLRICKKSFCNIRTNYIPRMKQPN